MKMCALLVFTNRVNLIFAISPLRSWRLGVLAVKLFSTAFSRLIGESVEAAALAQTTVVVRSRRLRAVERSWPADDASSRRCNPYPKILLACRTAFLACRNSCPGWISICLNIELIFYFHLVL